MKAFITKWALTQGIVEVDAEIAESSGDGKLIKWGDAAFSCYAYGEGSQWHRDKQKAIYRAQQMKANKIAGLKKQLAKLESMTFK